MLFPLGFSELTWSRRGRRSWSSFPYSPDTTFVHHTGYFQTVSSKLLWLFFCPNNNLCSVCQKFVCETERDGGLSVCLNELLGIVGRLSGCQTRGIMEMGWAKGFREMTDGTVSVCCEWTACLASFYWHCAALQPHHWCWDTTSAPGRVPRACACFLVLFHWFSPHIFTLAALQIWFSSTRTLSFQLLSAMAAFHSGSISLSPVSSPGCKLAAVFKAIMYDQSTLSIVHSPSAHWHLLVYSSGKGCCLNGDPG